MNIKVFYDECQLEETINFIATHNPSFLGQHDQVRRSILEHIQELVTRYPDLAYLGTMGYFVWAVMDEEEGIDNDENTLTIEFMVDPAVGKQEHHWVKKEFDKKLP